MADQTDFPHAHVWETRSKESKSWVEKVPVTGALESKWYDRPRSKTTEVLYCKLCGKIEILNY